jgi:hypothetical protein
MDYKELDSLITFRMGLPSIYHIMLGMSMNQTEEYAKELDRKETDNYDLNAFLKKYGVKVERTGFTGDTYMQLDEISIMIPINHLEEKDAKKLYDYFSYRSNVIEKRFSFTSDTDDFIKELNIFIHTDLYDITVTQETDDEIGKHIFIDFEADRDVNIDKLCCLAIIANNEKGFAKELLDYVEENTDYEM